MPKTSGEFWQAHPDQAVDLALTGTGVLPPGARRLFRLPVGQPQVSNGHYTSL